MTGTGCAEVIHGPACRVRHGERRASVGSVALRLSALLGLVLLGCASAEPEGKIAFSSNRDGKPEIYLMNADGSGLERLTYGPQYDTNPVWSRDGQHMAFNCEIQGNLDVCLMHADGSPAINLTYSPGADGSPT